MKFIPASVTRKVARALLHTQKHSPTLMFGAGIVGVVATTVLASKATLRIDEILEDTNTKVERMAEVKETNSEYTDKDYLSDRVTVYTHSALKLGRLYAPAIIVGTTSIALLTGSHIVLQRRNTGLMVAYAGLEKAYDEYRQRVIKDIGEEQELKYRYPTKSDSNKANKLGVVPDPQAGMSMYAKFFDEFNQNWERNPEYNMLFIRCQQNWANEKLIAQGHLFLNEVYDHLGIERTQAGAIVGWVMGTEGGDCYVDFGLYDDRPSSRSFVNGDSNSILLDFNVDGPIYHLIGRKS